MIPQEMIVDHANARIDSQHDELSIFTAVYLLHRDADSVSQSSATSISIS